MPHLYITTSGIPWRKHSYSAGNDFDQSAFKYYLKRVVGWKERDNRASFLFGRAIEKAIEFYHDNSGTGIIEKFVELWTPALEVPDLKFTKLEKDWATLNHMGADMLRLYMIRQPSLPIPLGGGSVFQREYGKEVFPGDPLYGEIVDAGKLDIVCYVDPKHPALVPVDWKPEFGALRPLIVDMKTSGVDFPEQMGMAAFDKQLRRYSWQSGIRDVALLWLVKKGLGYKNGSRVTLLVDKEPYKAGTEMLVAAKAENGVYLVNGLIAMEEMKIAQGRNAAGKLDTTKAADARKEKWLEQCAILVQESDFTRQRLQFNAGFVTPGSAYEAGQIAARQIVQIVQAWNSKQWPNTFGVRFPSNDMNDPYFKAFVLKDEAFKNEHFKLAEAADDDLFDDDSEPEEASE